MHETVFFNDRFIRFGEASLPAASSAALYGKGVFTTIAVREKKAFLWEKHWRRLSGDAEKIGVDLSDFSEDLLIGALAKLIEKNRIENARARITFFDESAGRIWNFRTNRKTGVLIATAETHKPPEIFRLALSPFRVNSASPLAGVKSCNYLENILALEDAKKRGFDEAIRLNEKNEIVSAATANIFWTKDERIFTPAVETGCLRGTTREFLLENFPVREKKSGVGELADADEIFLTSAGIGICAARFENEQKKSSAFFQLKRFLDLSEFRT